MDSRRGPLSGAKITGAGMDNVLNSRVRRSTSLGQHRRPAPAGRGESSLQRRHALLQFGRQALQVVSRRAESGGRQGLAPGDTGVLRGQVSLENRRVPLKSVEIDRVETSFPSDRQERNAGLERHQGALTLDSALGEDTDDQALL